MGVKAALIYSKIIFSFTCIGAAEERIELMRRIVDCVHGSVTFLGGHVKKQIKAQRP